MSKQNQIHNVLPVKHTALAAWQDIFMSRYCAKRVPGTGCEEISS